MKQIIANIRGYETQKARSIAIAHLARRGYNHFVPFKDVQATYALQYGKADWVQIGIWVDGGRNATRYSRLHTNLRMKG